MPDFAPSLETVFDSVPAEGSDRIEAVDGEIPSFVRGTYYLIGPARFVRGAVRYRHWLDGDGMVTTLRFGGERGDGAGRAALLTNRFVRSTKLVDEEAAGKALYRTFGTAFDGDRLLRGVALASPVNVSACFFAGRFLAFGEQGLPWELDPVTLETRGEHTFDGRLNALTPFAAHPKIDRVTGELFNFGVSFSAKRPTLTLYRFGADGSQIFRRRHDLDLPRSNHDFGLSERYAAFYLSPHLMDMEALRFRGASVLDALSWHPESGSRLLVLSREDGAEVASIPIGQGYCLHLANAFDSTDPTDGGHRLTLDLLELEEPVYPDYQELPNLFERVRPGRPVRLVFDLDRQELIERHEVAYHRACDFPAVARANETHPTTDTWLLGISTTGREGRKFFDELVHVRWDTPEEVGVYRTPAGRYLGGEPVFVGDPDAVPAEPGSDGGSATPRGVIIVQEIAPAARRSAFLLFDAFDVEKGPIVRLENRSPIPPCFHAGFEPA